MLYIIYTTSQKTLLFNKKPGMKLPGLFHFKRKKHLLIIE